MCFLNKFAHFSYHTTHHIYQDIFLMLANRNSRFVPHIFKFYAYTCVKCHIFLKSFSFTIDFLFSLSFSFSCFCFHYILRLKCIREYSPKRYYFSSHVLRLRIIIFKIWKKPKARAVLPKNEFRGNFLMDLRF